MEVKTVDTRDLIVQELKDRERSVLWLAKKTEIPYGTIYDCLVRKGFNLSWKNLERINEILETKFQ